MNLLSSYFDKILSKKLIKRLYQIDKSEWIRMYYSFNKWEFPMEFYKLMPGWWLTSQNIDRAYHLIEPVMRLINAHFSEKEQLRYLNVYMGDMTNDEYEYWFENVSLINSNSNYEEVNKYYHRRSWIKTIHWWEDHVFKKLQKIKFND